MEGMFSSAKRVTKEGYFDGECYDRSKTLDTFYPSSCRICRCFGEKAKGLKRCSACNMISYCSVDHQKEDWPAHKEFCKAMTNLNKKGQGLNSLFRKFRFCIDKKKNSNFFELQGNLTALAMFSSYEVREGLNSTLGRELKIHELEMLMYPRFCAVCFEDKPELLTYCKKCPQHSFCKKHLNNSNLYQEECLKFVSIASVTKHEEIQEELHSIVALAFPYQENNVKLPASTMNFLETYFPDALQISAALPEEKRLVFNSYLAERFSRPLTMVFTMEKLALNAPSVLIHVIGATPDECTNDWELIMHYLPQLNELKLVFIGPNLFDLATDKLKLCSKCEKIGKKITVECKNMMYERYFTERSFEKPDLVAGFNIGLNIYSSWNECLKVLGKVDSPLMITAYSRFEAMLDIEKVDSEYPSAKQIYFDKNPFHGFVYMRELMNFLSTKNQVIIIYKQLKAGQKCK